MEKQNQPSKDSTTPTDPKTPPSSPQHPPPSDDDSNKVDPSGASRSTGIMKTALQVLAELVSSESSESHEGCGNGGGGGSVASGGCLSLGGGSSGGTSLALAVGARGGPVAVVQEPSAGEGRGKKRKGSDVKDPPSGTPSCPVCFKEFSSWKGAFGHMRKHPDREYRGFYKPPVSTPSSAARVLSLGGDQGGAGEKTKGEGQSGEGKSSSPIRGLVFDLNQQPMDGAGSSSAAEGNEAPHADQERIVDEGLKGFDLNELPPNEDDE